MLRQTGNIIIILIISLTLSLAMFYSCKGSDTREKVDDTVEELAGKKQVDRMKEMENDIGDITDRGSERMDDLKETEMAEEE
jgi:hypothetical protein